MRTGLFTHFSDRKGMSLISVIVGIGVFSVMAMTIINVITNINNEMRGIAEKITLREVENELRIFLNKPPFCGCTFRGLKLDTSVSPPVVTSDPAGLPRSFAALPAYPAPCAPGTQYIIPAAGQKIGDSHIVVESIKIIDVVDTGGGSYVGSLTVSLDSQSLLRAVKPIKMPLEFMVDSTDPVAARRFSGCGSISVAPAGPPAGLVWWANRELRRPISLIPTLERLRFILWLLPHVMVRMIPREGEVMSVIFQNGRRPVF